MCHRVLCFCITCTSCSCYLMSYCHFFCLNVSCCQLFRLVLTLLLFQCNLLRGCCYLRCYCGNYLANQVGECSYIQNLCPRVPESRICDFCLWDYCRLCKPCLRVLLFTLHLIYFQASIIRMKTIVSCLQFLVFSLLNYKLCFLGFALELLEAAVPSPMPRIPRCLLRFL